MNKPTNTQFYKYGDPQTHKWIVIMWTNTPVNGVGPSMSCPFHEVGGLCAKTTCAILLHKELRVNIAVHVSKDIKRNTRKQKNKHKHKNKNKHKQNIAKSPVPYCFIISSELTLLSMFQNTLENTHKHKNKHRQNKKKHACHIAS